MGLAMAFGVASVAAAGQPPGFDPDNFGCQVTNPLFPLVPGTTTFYEGESEGVPTTNITEVTCDTKVILGVTTTVVHDRAFENGVPVEETFDWFATDCDGNVWYLGEDSTDLPSLSKEGSWEAGVDGAEPGFIMLANPQVGDRYYQEFARGVAEDQAKVISLNGSACVEYQNLCSDELLVTKETTRLDPGIVENKYYAERIGFIFGVMVKGGDEFSQLVDITSRRCRR
jgi:hypothetical protein